MDMNREMGDAEIIFTCPSLFGYHYTIRWDEETGNIRVANEDSRGQPLTIICEHETALARRMSAKSPLRKMIDRILDRILP